MATEALLPCPFDGGPAFLATVPYDRKRPDGDPLHLVRCRSCAAEGPWQHTETAAARGWNRRIERAAVLVDAVAALDALPAAATRDECLVAVARLREQKP